MLFLLPFSVFVCHTPHSQHWFLFSCSHPPFIFLAFSLTYFIISSFFHSLSLSLPPPLPAFSAFPSYFLFSHILQQHLTVSAGKPNAARAAAGKIKCWPSLKTMHCCLWRGGGAFREIKHSQTPESCWEPSEQLIVGNALKLDISNTGNP